MPALVYDADISDSSDVLVTMTLTSLGCPLGPVIMQEVNNALKDLPGIGETDVKLVWSPPWSPEAIPTSSTAELMSFDDVPENERQEVTAFLARFGVY